MATLMNQQQLIDLAQSVGFIRRNAEIAAAIALCEAPFMVKGVPHANFSAIGDQHLANEKWGFSYGAWQIRSLRADAGTGRTRDAERLHLPVFNATSARRIKLDAGSFKPWSTFNSGMYKAYLQEIFPPPPNTYVVVAGDTLGKIALKLGNKFTWQDLAETNGITSPYTIQIGQNLTLPWMEAGK